MMKMPDAILPNLVTFYDALEDLADGDPPVFEGHPTKLVVELGWPVQYYSKLRRYLLAMGCIEVLQRGAHHAMTKWQLVKPPTTELLTGTDPDTLVPSRDPSEFQQITKRRIKDIVEMLGGHEDRLTNIEAKLNLLLAQQHIQQGDTNA